LCKKISQLYYQIIPSNLQCLSIYSTIFNFCLSPVPSRRGKRSEKTGRALFLWLRLPNHLRIPEGDYCAFIRKVRSKARKCNDKTSYTKNTLNGDSRFDNCRTGNKQFSVPKLRFSCHTKSTVCRLDCSRTRHNLSFPPSAAAVLLSPSD
jgi:hypothetical protein